MSCLVRNGCGSDFGCGADSGKRSGTEGCGADFGRGAEFICGTVRNGTVAVRNSINGYVRNG